MVEAAFIGSTEARKLHTLASEQADSFASAGKLVPNKGAPQAEEATPGDEEDTEQAAAVEVGIGKGETLVARPSQLLEAVLAAGRKGLSIKRYKGLG